MTTQELLIKTYSLYNAALKLVDRTVVRLQALESDQDRKELSKLELANVRDLIEGLTAGVDEVVKANIDSVLEPLTDQLAALA